MTVNSRLWRVVCMSAVYIWRVWSQNAIKAKVKNWVTPAKTSTIDKKIQSRFHLFANCGVSNGYIAFWKQMEAGLYFPIYRRCFRGGNSICSLGRLSRFVTKLFIFTPKNRFPWSDQKFHTSQASNPNYQKPWLSMFPKTSTNPANDHFQYRWTNVHVKNYTNKSAETWGNGVVILPGVVTGIICLGSG